MSADADRRSPYQGLVPYTTEDAAWFFGRNEWSGIVIDNLSAYRASVLYGASGVGKSSLLHAGVIPRLQAQARENVTRSGRPEVLVAAFAAWSTDDPAGALGESVRRAVADVSAELAVDPPQGPLVEVLSAWAERIGGVLFVVLDQLEEHFFYHGKDDIGRAFEAELATALRRSRTPANFLLSIREDSLASLDRLYANVPGLLDHLIRMEHLDRAAAREAVERPLQRWNSVVGGEPRVTIEPELVDEILRQVEAGKLVIEGATGAGRVEAGSVEARIEAPYLQLVLTRLWDEEASAGSALLRRQTLDRLGGAEQIVHTHLDAAMATLPRREQDVADRVFRHLVTPSGTKIAHHTRDLAEYAETSEDVVGRLLNRLAGDARILRPLPNDAYEIYHDALAGPILGWRQRYQASGRGRLRLRRRAAFLVLSTTLSGLMVAAFFSDAFASLERKAVDARFAVRDSKPADSRVAVVAIDDATFDELNTRWPFRRMLHARVIDRLHRDGAKVIAYDIQFTEPTDATNDNALILAVERARNLVLATTEVSSTGKSNVFGGAYGELGATVGQANLLLDGDGVIRHMPYAVSGLASFALVAAEEAGSVAARPSRLKGNDAWIDYAGPPGTYRAVSFARVLRGRFAPGTFRGKVVVVGPTAPSLQDLHSTPTARSATNPMSGAEIQANAITTVLRGFPLQSLGEGATVALIVCLGLIAPLVSLRLGLRVTFVVMLLLAAAYVVTLQLAFEHGFVLPMSYPLLILVVTAVGALFVDAGIPAEMRTRRASARRALTAVLRHRGRESVRTS